MMIIKCLNKARGISPDIQLQGPKQIILSEMQATYVPVKTLTCNKSSS